MKSPIRHESEPTLRTAGQHFRPAPDVQIIDAEPEAIEDMPEPAVPEDVAEPDPRAWRAIDDDTPRDGTLIEVVPAADVPDTAFARWRITRRRDHTNRRWEVMGYWAEPITREPVPFEPKLWRMPEGFALPGMVV